MSLMWKTSMGNKGMRTEFLRNIGPFLWQWIFDNHLTAKEETWGVINIVLREDADITIDRACVQSRRLRENWNEKETYTS